MRKKWERFQGMSVPEDGGVGGDAVGKPDVAADGAVVADMGVAAEDGGPGIDDHVVADLRVPVDALDGVAVFADREALGSERDALVKLYVVADYGGFTDDDACAVVDEEIASDGCARMDVDSVWLWASSVMILGM